jgi:hypothetical protein
MATEVVLKAWSRIQLDWPNAYYREHAIESDTLCFETQMWLNADQEKFLRGKNVGSKIELETPHYPEGFAGTSLYTRISLIFECEKEAFEFVLKHL